jgi:hypothetical protein
LSKALFLLSQYQPYGQIRKEKEQKNGYLDESDAAVIDQVKLMPADIKPLRIHLIQPAGKKQIEKKPQQQKAPSQKKRSDQYPGQRFKEKIITLRVFHSYLSVFFSASP